MVSFDSITMLIHASLVKVHLLSLCSQASVSQTTSGRKGHEVMIAQFTCEDDSEEKDTQN